MLRYLFILLFSFLIALATNAQKPAGRFSEIDQRNFSMAMRAVSFLKKDKTPVIHLTDSAQAINRYAVYDSLINKYFDLSYWRDSVKKKDINFQNRIVFQKSILYNIDHFLDVLPADSIGITPLRETKMAEDSIYYPANAMVVFLYVSGSRFYTHVILFNPYGKIFAVDPLIDFDNENAGALVEDFFNRQKGYKEIKSLLLKN